MTLILKTYFDKGQVFILDAKTRNFVCNRGFPTNEEAATWLIENGYHDAALTFEGEHELRHMLRWLNNNGHGGGLTFDDNCVEFLMDACAHVIHGMTNPILSQAETRGLVRMFEMDELKEVDAWFTTNAGLLAEREARNTSNE